MFSVEWEKTKDMWDASGRNGTVKNGDKYVCKIQTWAFGSCACFALSRFSDNTHFVFNKDNTEAFFKYICTLDKDWEPKEFYFMLSRHQLQHDRLKGLFRHPNVKLRDVFMNKSHGPNRVYLFRYSDSKDFPRLKQLKGKE